MELIKFDNVSLGYEGQEILRNISFAVNPGDYLCIVGENGSGKSTLMKGLLGIIKPYKGTITRDKAKIGYLPQMTTNQKDFPVSVEEIILSGCLARHKFNPFYTKADRKSMYEISQKMEISDILKSGYQELSGGQQQRVLLARALCAAGNTLILDEPVAALDPVITGELYKTIDMLNKDGMTVIMVSHDIKSALKYATHIMHIDNGSHFFGTVEEYIASENGKAFTGGDING